MEPKDQACAARGGVRLRALACPGYTSVTAARVWLSLLTTVKGMISLFRSRMQVYQLGLIGYVQQTEQKVENLGAVGRIREKAGTPGQMHEGLASLRVTLVEADRR